MKSRLLAVFVFAILAASCKIYSFSGVTVDGTITISSFFHDVDAGPPDLAAKFTDSMRDYFQQNTNLTFVDENADLIFEGAVTSYRLSPVSQQATQDVNALSTAAQTRVTITVSVIFTNIQKPEEDFEKSFSFFSDFDADQSIQDVEEELVDEIYEQIILNIFNASVANW